ncbi:MAG TPA: NAD(P)H-hydrate dehydratase [Actinomycetota bacterium]|nr:NAD(P)H-hydrate dehydratase [Actinomycetota bacterium]
MKPILTAAETRELDRRTEARGVAVSDLMERAGRAVARAAVEVCGGTYGRRAVVVCGKGHNGGDGLVAARYLARWGMRVAVLLLADRPSLGPVSAAELDALSAAGVRARPWAADAAGRELARADVAVDAVFGTGFRGVAEGPHAEALEALGDGRVPVVAVDIPSGVEGDTGLVRGPAARAAVTVTFGALKAGHLFHPGAARPGRVEVVDIGFPPDLVGSDLLLVEREDAGELLPRRAPDTHKRRSGVVLVVAGSRRMTGAVRLVTQGAYRAGAGLVRVAVPEGILAIVQAGLAEATFVPLPEGPAGSVSERAWDRVAADLDDVDAVAIGPGLSTDDETPAFVRRLVREAPVPVIVDADAINAFAGQAAAIGDHAAERVLTPHTGEFARLFGMPARDVPDDRIGAVRKSAAETGAVVLLKGNPTIVARPDGEARLTPTGTPALATGGTGDVLTGVAGAYAARGLEAFDAATLAAYVHGVAGRVAGASSGEGTVATDVAAAIPEAVRRVAEATP